MSMKDLKHDAISKYSNLKTFKVKVRNKYYETITFNPNHFNVKINTIMQNLFRKTASVSTGH